MCLKGWFFELQYSLCPIWFTANKAQNSFFFEKYIVGLFLPFRSISLLLCWIDILTLSSRPDKTLKQRSFRFKLWYESCTREEPNKRMYPEFEARSRSEQSSTKVLWTGQQRMMVGSPGYDIFHRDQLLWAPVTGTKLQQPPSCDTSCHLNSSHFCMIKTGLYFVASKKLEVLSHKAMDH